MYNGRRAFLVFAVVVYGGVCFADTTAQDGYWSQNTTWVDSSPPTAVDDADIDNTHDVVITNQAALCSALNIPNGSGSATLTISNGASLTSGGVTYIGNGGYGKLTINGGAFTNTTGTDRAIRLGTSAGALGEIEISDGILKHDGSSTYYSLVVGDTAGATGRVTQTGGMVETVKNIDIGYAMNSYGEYILTGGNVICSRYLRIAYDVSTGAWMQTGGDLVISNYTYIPNKGYGLFSMGGGTVTSRNVYVANSAGSYGKLLVTNGIFTTSGAEDYYIGCSGYGELEVTDGDVAPGNNLVVGFSAGGTGKVTQVGGTVQAGTYFHIGYNGYGEYELTGGKAICASTLYAPRANADALWTQSGGELHVGALSVGNRVGYEGVFNISDGIISNVGYALVGGIGYGEMHIHGGELTFGDDFNLGYSATGTGLVTQSGGTLNVNAQIHVAYHGFAELNISGGAITNTTTFYVGRYSDSTGTVVHSGGDIAVGGNFNIPHGTYHVIGSDAAIDFAQALDFYGSSSNIIRAHIGRKGISLVKVNTSEGAYDADLSNIRLELGMTNDLDCRVGDQFAFIRVPEARSLNLAGMTISNLDAEEGWEFTAGQAISNGYKWLMLTCTKRPPKSTSIIIK